MARELQYRRMTPAALMDRADAIRGAAQGDGFILVEGVISKKGLVRSINPENGTLVSPEVLEALREKVDNFFLWARRRNHRWKDNEPKDNATDDNDTGDS